MFKVTDPIPKKQGQQSQKAVNVFDLIDPVD